jgi:hypothetical protein
MCPIGQVKDHPNAAICDHAPHVMEGRAVGAVDLTQGLSHPRVELATIRALVLELDQRSRRDPEGSTPTRKQHRLDAAEVDKLVQAYREGARIVDLATVFGVSRYTVGQHLDRRGVVRRPKAAGLIALDEAATLYADGWSLSRLAARYEVDAGTVRTALLGIGVQTRPRPGRS